MARKSNPFAKGRDIENPHAIFTRGDWEWRVLKTYRRPDLETGEYDRWFCAVKSPHTYGSFELGDTYKSEVLAYAVLDKQRTSDEWLEAYGHKPTAS